MRGYIFGHVWRNAAVARVRHGFRLLVSNFDPEIGLPFEALAAEAVLREIRPVRRLVRLLLVAFVAARKLLCNDNFSALAYRNLRHLFLERFIDALAIYFRMRFGAVLRARYAGVELHGAVEAGEDLVLGLFEPFLTVDMVHFDVKRPALAHQNFGAAFVRTFIMIFEHKIILLF